MKKTIGNIVLDYTYYRGTDDYTDGEIEDYLLDIVKEGKQEEALYSGTEWPVLYHLSDIRENLLEWYSFDKNANLLEIGSGCGAITSLLSRKVNQVTCIELSEKRSLINAYRNETCDNVRIMLGNFQDIEPNLEEKYDYITLIGVWEYSGLYVGGNEPYIQMLQMIQKHLKKDGKIIIAIENKMGLKYWNGAVEDHTGKQYSGLNDYFGEKKVKTFSKPEIENIFEKVNIQQYKFYYPVPDYKLPDVIYSDCFLPGPGAVRSFGKDYNSVHIYNFNDATVSDQICADGMFPYFANSYLVITGEQSNPDSFAKYCRCRKQGFRIKTDLVEVNGEKYIRKTALNELAQKHIDRLKVNEEKWKGCLKNLNCAEGYLEHGKYVVPYIEGEDVETLFYKWRNMPEFFLEQVCWWLDTYLKPEKTELFDFTVTEEFCKIFGECYPADSKTLKYTNVDLIFSNLKFTPDKRVVCFDYEWVFDFPIPYGYVIWRSINQLYNNYSAYLKQYFSKDQFVQKVGISLEDACLYEKMESHFMEYVFSKRHKEEYLRRYRKNAIMNSIRIF